jgi:Tfp pilus assembly protein PilO
MSQRDKILLAVVAAVVVLAGGWMLVAKPKREDARVVDAQIETAQTELAGVSSKAAQYRAARRSLQRHPEAFTKAGRALPNRAAMPDLLRTLTKTARGTGVKIKSLTTGDGAGDETTPGISTVGLNLTFTGQFLELQRYLSRLQRFVEVSQKDVDANGRLVSLDGVSLAPGDAASGALTAEVTATVYVMQPGALTPGAAAPATGATGPAAPTSTAPAGGAQ